MEYNNYIKEDKCPFKARPSASNFQDAHVLYTIDRRRIMTCTYWKI